MSMQAIETWIGQAQIWQVGAILLGVMLVFAAAGYGVRRWQEARSGPPGEKEGNQEGYLVSAVLGLFAFLLGFTFALAVDRYDTRRGAVLDEANAIGTTYLRTQLLEAPHRERISRLLVAYTDNRIALAKEREPVASDVLAKNDGLITNLWQATVAAFPSIKDYDFSSSYLESMNTVIDLDTTRKVGRRAHVPTTVFVVLGLYAFVTAGVLGYVLSGVRGRIAASVVLALFAMSFLLIIDIDRPTMGTINESQAPMEWLRASMKVWQPHVFDIPPD